MAPDADGTELRLTGQSAGLGVQGQLSTFSHDRAGATLLEMGISEAEEYQPLSMENSPPPH